LNDYLDMRSVESKEAFQRYSYFSAMTAVSREKLEQDPDARWIVQFNPLVTQAIDTLTYRQYNYTQMMSHQTQLARWLHKLLSLKFTFASLAAPFEMRYSTIKRDSALLSSYTRERAAIAALDAALNELKTGGVLMKVAKNEIRGDRGKLEDVVYTLTASMAFIAETKAANKRENLAIEKKDDSVSRSTPSKKR
jgi:hypothetical protein